MKKVKETKDGATITAEMTRWEYYTIHNILESDTPDGTYKAILKDICDGEIEAYGDCMEWSFILFSDSPSLMGRLVIGFSAHPEAQKKGYPANEHWYKVFDCKRGNEVPDVRTLCGRECFVVIKDDKVVDVKST